MIIDVSRHNGLIDWPRVRAAGVTTAIMRASMGAFGTDDRFSANWQGSGQAGIEHRGVYHLVITTSTAAGQFENIIKRTGGDFGNEPLTLDCERTKAERDAQVAGSIFPKWAYTAMLDDLMGKLSSLVPLRIYTSAVEWAAITTEPLWALNCLHWIAQYNEHIAEPDCPPGWGWDWWQYSSTGHVDGISTNVDLSRTNAPADTDAALRAGIGAQADEILRLVRTT